MRVTGSGLLKAFSQSYPDANAALETWREHMRSRPFTSFSDLRSMFGSVDVVGNRFVFDIRGNRYRLITGIDFTRQCCCVKAVLTHAQYDRRQWMKQAMIKEAPVDTWVQPDFLADRRPLSTHAEYDLAMSVMDNLIEHGAMHEAHPSNSLYATLFDIIHDFEEVHFPP
ncbi:type II toxin-antitoxin system HigB family toxin [Bacillus sp. NP157]|nr:type II toxin-antitoxin system HigB family toxin [Bacillus sp. NP157]